MRSLLLGLIFAGLGAHADCAKQFKSEGAAIPRALLKKGYGDFGPFNLHRFIAGIQKVEVRAGGNQGTYHRTRSTARWIKEDGRRTVVVDCAWFKKFPADERMIMAMHEFAGPEGLYDEWYTLSIVSWMLSRNDVRQVFRDDELKAFAGYVTEVAQKGGGVVGVGGGGEIMSVRYKLRLLKLSLQRLSGARTEYDREVALTAMATMLDERVNSFEPERMWGKRWNR